MWSASQRIQWLDMRFISARSTRACRHEGREGWFSMKEVILAPAFHPKGLLNNLSFTRLFSQQQGWGQGKQAKYTTGLYITRQVYSTHLQERSAAMKRLLLGFCIAFFMPIGNLFRPRFIQRRGSVFRSTLEWRRSSQLVAVVRIRAARRLLRLRESRRRRPILCRRVRCCRLHWFTERLRTPDYCRATDSCGHVGIW